MRQIVLDTETTGLEPADGHRIIEIGCVELEDRKLTGNNCQIWINPERDIDEGALQVLGITREFLADKPVFADVVDDFLAYVDGAELVIHNAPFDIGFLDHELKMLAGNHRSMRERCGVLDTLVMAKQKHPGQKNSLDALCRRYGIDNSHRELHGALLDAQILAEVYLIMTGGQTRLSLGGHEASGEDSPLEQIRRLPTDRKPLPVIHASASEQDAHQQRLAQISEALGEPCLWEQSQTQPAAD